MGGTFQSISLSEGFPVGTSDKESTCQCRRHMGLIPGSGRSPGEGNGTPLHYSGLKISGTEEPGGLQSMGSQRVGHN